MLQRQQAKLDEQIKACTIRAPEDGLVIYATSIDRNQREPVQEGTTVRLSQWLIRLPNVKTHEGGAQDPGSPEAQARRNQGPAGDGQGAGRHRADRRDAHQGQRAARQRRALVEPRPARIPRRADPRQDPARPQARRPRRELPRSSSAATSTPWPSPSRPSTPSARTTTSSSARRRPSRNARSSSAPPMRPTQQ